MIWTRMSRILINQLRIYKHDKQNNVVLSTEQLPEVPEWSELKHAVFHSFPRRPKCINTNLSTNTNQVELRTNSRPILDQKSINWWFARVAIQVAPQSFWPISAFNINWWANPKTSLPFFWRDFVDCCMLQKRRLQVDKAGLFSSHIDTWCKLVNIWFLRIFYLNPNLLMSQKHLTFSNSCHSSIFRLIFLRKLKWKPKNNHLKMYLLSKMVFFHPVILLFWRVSARLLLFFLFGGFGHTSWFHQKIHLQRSHPYLPTGWAGIRDMLITRRSIFFKNSFPKS